MSFLKKYWKFITAGVVLLIILGLILLPTLFGSRIPSEPKFTNTSTKIATSSNQRKTSTSSSVEVDNLKFLSNRVFINQSFINSKGEKKRLIAYIQIYSENTIYVTDDNLNRQNAVTVNFKQEVFKNQLEVSPPSPGKTKYFHILGSVGDYGRSAVIDENGNVVTETIYEKISSRVREISGDPYPGLPYFEKWLDDTTFQGRIVDRSGNKYRTVLNINGNLISIEKST